MSAARPVAADKKRALLYLAIAFILFSGVMLVSRLADFGVVPGEEFGAGDWRRGKVALDIEVVPAEGGPRRDLNRNLVLAPGDQLRFTYGKTRFLYLWVVRVDRGGQLTPLLPAAGTKDAGEYGRPTARNGETVPELVNVDAVGPVVMLGIFTPVPRRLDELQSAADAVKEESPEVIARDMYLPGLRFVHVLEVREAAAAAPLPPED